MAHVAQHRKNCRQLGPGLTPCLSPVVIAADESRDSSGAKLGAILCGSLWTVVDAGGLKTPSFRRVWTSVDCCGRCL